MIKSHEKSKFYRCHQESQKSDEFLEGECYDHVVLQVEMLFDGFLLIEYVSKADYVEEEKKQ
jgi:hypothetical protein